MCRCTKSPSIDEYYDAMIVKKTMRAGDSTAEALPSNKITIRKKGKIVRREGSFVE